MKITSYISAMAFAAVTLGMASCQNADRDFPDYEGGTTAYFAYQFPVRTLILGNDIYDNSLDVQHKCQIWSTMGGAYNGRNAVVDFVVDPTLCDNLFFVDEGGNPAEPVLPMPTEYYTLSSNQIKYNGDLRGYVEVQFSDAFFEDPKSIDNTYVIPLLMTNVTGIDHILTGTPRLGITPESRTDLESWAAHPRDFVLYCVKYMNPWQGKYIRRGVDKVIEGGLEKIYIRKDMSLVNSDPEHYSYDENPVNQNDEVCGIKTKNMTQAIFPVSFKATGGSKLCDLLLTFDGDKCEISSATEGVTVTGSGEYITKGTERPEYKDYQWGSLNGKPVHRDILRMEYDVDFGTAGVTVHTADTLVMQTRESNKKQFFSTKYVSKN